MDYTKYTIVLDCDTAGDGFDKALSAAGFTSIVRKLPGMTMKEAFSVALGDGGDYLITVRECDGFTAQDVVDIAQALSARPGALYIGARNNEAKQSFQEKIFQFLSGIEAQDIHTSLMGMDAGFAREVQQTKGKETAFYTNILLLARKNSMDIRPVHTSAAYSHAAGWEILTASFMLYAVFIKFSISAAIAYVVDIVTFFLFQKAFAYLVDEYKILIATVLSRILCSFVTYILNRGAVFRSQAKSAGAVVRFIILSVGQLVLSWLLVWGLGYVFGSSDLAHTALKVVVDLVIFIASFTIQRDWVFKESKSILK
ncbi:MAG: GtrA family protein [Christensenellaceae bacterium]